MKWEHDPIPISGISNDQEILLSTWGRMAWLEVLAATFMCIRLLTGQTKIYEVKKRTRKVVGPGLVVPEHKALIYNNFAK